jgi:phosphoribosylcarboxyaminoimidazole (NCAIR) mutase
LAVRMLGIADESLVDRMEEFQGELNAAARKKGEKIRRER